MECDLGPHPIAHIVGANMIHGPNAMEGKSEPWDRNTKEKLMNASKWKRKSKRN